MDWIDFTHTHLLKRERESFVLLLKILPFLEQKLPPPRAEEDSMHRRCCSRRHHRDEDVVSFFFDLIRVASSSSSFSSFAAREKKKLFLAFSVNEKTKKASSHAIGDLEKKRRTTTTTTTTTTIPATKAIRRLRFLLKYPRVKENLSVENGAACLKSILPQRYMKSTISSSERIREDEDEEKTKDYRQRLLQLRGASVDDSARRNKRKEDIAMLETTLERLKFSLEVAEKRAKEEMERMARGADEEDDDDSFDSSAFLTLKKERGRQGRLRNSDSDSGATTTKTMEKTIKKTMVTAS